MRIKRFISVLLVTSVLATGCQAKTENERSVNEKSQVTEQSSTTVPTSASNTPTPTNTSTPTPSPTPKIENISNNTEGHYQFNPCVFGSKNEET